MVRARERARERERERERELPHSDQEAYFMLTTLLSNYNKYFPKKMQLGNPGTQFSERKPGWGMAWSASFLRKKKIDLSADHVDDTKCVDSVKCMDEAQDKYRNNSRHGFG